jgi:O-antigen/teichoic acid export membrane protein
MSTTVTGKARAASESLKRVRAGFGRGSSGSAPRSASKRAVLTTADQAFSSASNFIVGVAVARIAGPQGLGGFSLAYAFWLVLAALHRSLVTDPMAIENDAVHADASDRLRRGFASEVTMGLAAAACLVFIGIPLYFGGQHTFGLAMLAVIPWLPVLLVQDYWRWVGFMRREPGKALANDTVYNIVQGACFATVALTRTHSIVAVIASWGLGATAGAAYGLWQFKIRPTLRGGIAGLRARWHMSKWLAGNSITGWASSQASVLLAGFILGPAGLGALRAAQTLVTGPALVLIQAGGSIGLPEASRALAARGWSGLRRVSYVISVAGIVSIGVVGVAVVFMGGPLLRWTYGPEFSRYWSASELFALAYLITSIGLGPILVLKTTRNTPSLFRVQVISLVVSIASVSVLAVTNGVIGAASAAIVSSVANLIGLIYYTRRAQHNLMRSEMDSARDGDAAEDGTAENGPEQPETPGSLDQIRNNDTPIAVEFG